MKSKSAAVRQFIALAWTAAFALSDMAYAAERPVVIESFSGISCTFCYGAGMALDHIGQEYSRRDVLTVTYHEADDYALPFCTARRNYYVRLGSPIAWFNGFRYHEGGSSFAEGPPGILIVYNAYVQQIQAEQNRTSTTVPFQLRLTGRTGPDNPELTLRVSSTTGYPRSVKAHFLITEDGVPVSEPPNGKTVLNALARAYLGERTVTLTAPGMVVVTASFSGTIPYYPDGELHPLVFLQDNANKEIVGAVGVFSPPASTSRWRLYR